MKFLVILFTILVVAKASVIGISPLLATRSVIKGASSAGAAIGLDGAVVTAVDGATVVGVGPVGTAHASAVVSPGILPASPIVAAAPVVAAAPAVLAAAPAILAAAPASSAVIAGPSGAIAASSGGAIGVAPVVSKTVVAAPAVVSASALVAPAIGHVGLLGGHGLIL
ncbi:hypothetical protein QE152_g14352 [Popillia japonica]|uniref:Uncharacterized protein n=1 Tax=Popillia japonica TaxID=7064 RepID=A0AAW1L9K5_POPJA